MKKVSKVFIVLAILVLATSGVYAKDAPGKADNFYRGVTTLAPVVTTELVSSTSEVVSSTSVASDPVVTTSVSDPVVVDTRVIGQGNGNPTGNLQNKSAVTTTTTKETTVTTTSVIETTNVYDVTTTIGAHHGAPNSNGKALAPVVTVTQDTQVVESTQVDVSTEVATTSETVVGDWEAAYSVPSGKK